MEMIDALSLANQWLKSNLTAPEGDEYEIVPSAVEETEQGWYFPYQTVRFLRTRDLNYSVVGNWPIFVTKSGEVLGPKRPAS